MKSVVVLFVLLGLSSRAEARKPNVVMLFADDLGYGELGSYGGKEIPTPNLDALAKSGTLFTDGYVSAAVCSPSRAGLMTGRYQQRFGYHHNPPDHNDPGFKNFGLPDVEVTIAQEIKKAGYTTGMIGKWHLGFRKEQHPVSKGFDEFFGHIDGSHPYIGELKSDPILRGTVKAPESQYLTRAYAREAVSFIERHRKEPFFLYVAFNAVHLPFHAEPQMLARFAHIKDQNRRYFAALLAYMDDATGEIVASLRKQGLEKDTLVVFVSDNGGITGRSTCRNTPLRGVKGQFFEGGVRVPFMMSWNGTIPAGQRYQQPVSSRDLFPTFLSVATDGAYRNPSGAAR
jgi:arylsulfatase A-like enzyme